MVSKGGGTILANGISQIKRKKNRVNSIEDNAIHTYYTYHLHECVEHDMFIFRMNCD